MAHGHFLEMGGFRLVSDEIHRLEEPEQPGWMSTTADWEPYAEYIRQRERCQLGILTFERFKEVVGDPNYVFPVITPAQIQDRSKGDGLSKLLAILQTSWFILQCIARGFEGLSLTELELITLAIASLNAITYAFWWSKPLGVQEPVNVYVTARAGLAGENSRSVGSTARDVIYTLDEFWGCVAFIIHPPRLRLNRETDKVEKAQDDETVATRVALTLRKLRYKLTHSIRRYFRALDKIVNKSGDIHCVLNWVLFITAYFFLLVLLSPLFTILFIASFTFTTAFEIVTTNKIRPGATHVPSFYAPRTKSDKFSRMIVFAIFGVIFGGIHCIGWNFTFPTRSEKSLWQYTSLVLTAIPVVATPIDCILENVNLDGRIGKTLRLLLGFFMTALLSLYVPARLSLIAQALVLLRDQPPGAYYVAVNWTKYIPHLFS